MSEKKLRVVHYLNQFYAGIGGEEKADVPPSEKEGPVGPGLALKAAFGQNAAVVATVICGDSYFSENLAEASATVLGMIKKHNPDVVVAGPAFNAGRYGVACGAVAQAVWEEMGVPVVSGMFPENPGVDLYRKFTYIVETGSSAASMRQVVPKIAQLALKLGRKEPMGSAQEEGYLERGVRQNIFVKQRGSQRAVDMLLAKLRGEPFTTEYPLPTFDRVPPVAAVADVSQIKVAVVTSGGIVPKGNPDRIEASSATKFGKYDLAGVADLTAESYETAHGGYDPTYANEDADRVLPVDVLRELETEGKIGELHRYFYTTTGNGTSVANAVKFAKAIGAELLEDGVQAVILTST